MQQLGPDRIEMGVIAHSAQIPVPAPFDHPRLVSPAKNVAAQIVPVIEPVGVGAQKPAHPSDQVGLWRFDHQMKMIFHQTKGVNLESGFLASLGQSLDEIMTIPIIPEDGSPAIPPAEHMIDRAGILNANLPWH